MHIYLVVFDRNAVALSEKLFDSVQSYIDETYVQETIHAEHSVLDGIVVPEFLLRSPRVYRSNACNEDILPSELSVDYAAEPIKAARSLDDLVNELDETFSESLIRLIDQKGLKDPDVYKKANVDRKLFSKIKNNKDYQPKKSTAIAFCIALELNLDETLNLLSKAGFTLSHSSKADVIVEYFIEHENYNMFDINTALFTFGQPCIGD